MHRLCDKSMFPRLESQTKASDGTFRRKRYCTQFRTLRSIVMSAAAHRPGVPEPGGARRYALTQSALIKV
jgi:hypothetical protein